jgi:hypothetical protein
MTLLLPFAMALAMALLGLLLMLVGLACFQLMRIPWCERHWGDVLLVGAILLLMAACTFLVMFLKVILWGA